MIDLPEVQELGLYDLIEVHTIYPSFKGMGGSIIATAVKGIHKPTGITIQIPTGELHRSEIRRRAYIMNMFALLITLQDLDPVTLMPRG